MAVATVMTPATTAVTVTTSRTAMWTAIDRPPSRRSTSMPTAPTDPPASSAYRPISNRSVMRTLVAVADAPRGEDAGGRRRVGLDLLPQPSNVDGDGRLVAELPA